MDARRRLAGSVLALIYAAPWVWLMCFCTFVVAVTLETGRFPSYSNPDPKHVDGVYTLYEVTMATLVTTALSPLFVAAHITSRAVVGANLHDQRVRLLAYALGVSVAAFVIFGNPLGLSSWLFD